MQRRGVGVFVILMCAAMAGLVPIPAFGQAVYGNIFGTVTDPTGAAVPGARVVVTSVGQASTKETTTNTAGNYQVTHLIPGKYNVRAEATGFKAYVVESIQVFADVSARVDAKLEIGTVAETVTVTAEDVPLLKTDRADVSTVFTGKIAELPIFDRNFTALQLITPGTQSLMWQHASSENPQGSLQIMVNGQHFSGVSFQLDGTDNRDPILGIIVVNPTLESVTQIKVTTASYDAEFGQALSGVVTAHTKSGTNEWHGSAFWFRRNDVTQARDPFTQSVPDPVSGKLKPDTLWNLFGGSLGGPIVKDKLFIFGDFQGTRRKSGRSVLINVPTALVRSTCLAGLPCNLSEYPTQIFDPQTGDPGPDGLLGTADDPGTGRTPFAGNIIPAAQISPQAVAILQQLPAPNAGPGVSNNFSSGGSEKFDDEAFNTRVDYSRSENLRIFGRYSYADFRKSAVGVFGEVLGGLGLSPDGFAGSAPTRNQSIAVGFDYTLSPTLLTDFRFGFFRYRVQVLPGGVGTSPAADAGIPGLNTDPFFTSGMPEMNIEGTGGFRLGFALGTNRCNCPLNQRENQWQFVNNWTKLQGKHTVRFGADIRYADNLRVPSDKHRAGQLSFNDARTQDTALGGGLGLATFLLGDVTFFERYVSTVLDAGETQWRWFFFGQDTWRVNPKWTVNYGLRWEIYFPQEITNDAGGGWLDTSTGEILVGGVGGISLDGNTKNSFTNLAPRIGIAYQAREKMVVRLGYGRSFDIGVFGSIFGHSVTQNLPVLATQEIRSPGGVSWLRSFTLAVGPSAFVFPAVPSNGRIPLGPGIAQFVQPFKMRLGTVDNWNATIQYQITPTLSAEVGYVGNKGTHGFTDNAPDYNGNMPSIAGFPAVPADQRKPFFPLFGWTQDLRYHANDASNNYHSMQAKLEKRFARGYQFLAHYTWSKAMNHDSDYYVHNGRLNYGVADFDRTHAFVLSGLSELPFGRGKPFLADVSGVVNHILGGWQINGSVNWSSGLPFSPRYRDCGADRDTGPCRPDLVGDPGVSNPSQFGWFQTSSVTGLANGQTSGPWRRPQVGSFGLVGRNSLRGPRFFQTNMAIFKNVQVTEALRVQFRAEGLNIFNVVNLGQPRDCVDCNPAEDGKIFGLAAGASMRQWQFALRLEF